MKTLDILIVVLVVLVLASGGFLGYLVFTNYISNDSLSQNGEGVPTEAVKPLCIDTDDDGYGENCPLGPDCDDTEFDRNVECKTLDGSIGISGESVTYKVGDTIKLDLTFISSSVPEEKLGNIKLRVDYDQSLLKFNKFEPNEKVIEPQIIDLDDETRIVYDLIALTSGTGLKSGDLIGTLEFEALGTGLANVKVGKDTRIAVLYELQGEGGSVDIPIQ